jgi:polysaccharide pyruvyl transferase WcaK-like protein
MGGAEALRALARADLVAIGGGGIFGNDMGLLTQLLPLVAAAARVAGKDTAFLAIGAYSSTPVWVRRCLRAVAARSELVTVRDVESAAVLGAPPDAVLVDDPAIDLEPAPAATGRAALLAAGVDADTAVLGISLKPTHYPDRNARQIEVAVELADWWDEHVGGDVAMLCFSEHGDNGLGAACSDVSMAAEVARRVRAPGRVHAFGTGLSPTVLKSAIGSMAAVVGHRLHSQIFAVSIGTPCLGISYERKADSYLAEVGAPRVDLFGLRAEPILEWLDGLRAAGALAAPSSSRQQAVT